MYVKSTTKAGRTIEIEKYYTYRYGPKGKGRGKRANKMTEAQRRANNRQAEKRLRRLVNANFGEGDLHVVLSYAKAKGEPNRTKEEMKTDAEKFLRRLRAEYKKAGKELKYIHVMEIGEKGARHHHLIVNHIDTRILQKCWGSLGRVMAAPLDGSGQYKKLSGYLLKFSNRTVGTEDALMTKRWNASRNLVRPVTEVEVVSDRSFFRSEAKVPPELSGRYYVDQETVEKGVNADGYGYFRYTLVEYEEQTDGEGSAGKTGNAGKDKKNTKGSRKRGAKGRPAGKRAERRTDEEKSGAEGKA